MTKTRKTIPPYQHLFSKQSLNRAYEYVDFIENVQLSANSISCKVEGSYPYKVKIAWDKDDYTELSCTCPYDYEGYCKHIAAVLMYLEEMFPEELSADKKQQKPEWKKIVEDLSKEELLALITEYAAEDENLVNTIMIKYAPPSRKVNIDRYKKIVNNVFDTVSGDFGFIDYQDVIGVSHLISNLLDKAKSERNFQESFSINAAVAEVCIDYIQNADDSNGSIGGLIYEAFENIEHIFYNCQDETFKKLIFEWLERQMRNKDYSDYGCDEALSKLYFELGSNESYTRSVFQFIDEQIAKYEKGTDWHSKYHHKEFLQEKMNLLKNTGKTQEAQALIEDNLHLSDFRKMRVNQLLEQKDYSKAVSLIKEGIKISEQEDLAGITHDWKNLLLRIYQEQNLHQELKTLSRNMFIDNPDSMEYYRMYKRTIEESEWNAERDCIIDELNKKRRTNSWYYFPNHLASVYIEEKMWTELFAEVKKANNISATSRYATYLAKDYSSELIELYHNSIVKYARMTGRNIYEEVKKYLVEMSKLENGLAKAKTLRDNLLATYKNRPAMKEILAPLFR